MGPRLKLMTFGKIRTRPTEVININSLCALPKLMSFAKKKKIPAINKLASTVGKHSAYYVT